MTKQNNLEIQEKILPVKLEDEMRSSYIDYAMSVIVGRALPDVRDGLKPVHRRILYAMHEQGMVPTKPYKKSARVVGEVLGKYHPHGDIAVYDSLVRMAQNFAQRYTLIDGQGNFGSVDGDSPAAMRYTEARLSHLSVEILEDIDRDTVDFVPNFDESLEEPTILPCKLPNLLINGSSGIAVGMATNIPPHNVGEVVDAVIKVIDKPDVELPELMEVLPGPDFPTGGFICGRDEIAVAYATGRGLLTVRAKINVEELKNGKKAIIVSEIPYQVNKSQLVERIAELAKDKKVNGISDLRDESDRTGMRIYIELKRDIEPEIVLNQLYKHTPLQETFGINMVALVDGAPVVLNLRKTIDCFISHRETIVTRRTKFDLKKAEARAHILEGLRIAISNLDAVIKLIRASKNVETARSALMDKFELTEIQANAILEMRLQQLTALERDKIDEEYSDLIKKIADLKDILAKRPRVLKIVKTELTEMKEKFADSRRTQIIGKVEEVLLENLIPEEEVAVFITQKNFVKRLPVKTFQAQLRGGRGIGGMGTHDEDIIEKIFVSSTHNYLLCFTDQGKVYRLRVFEIPDASRQSRGQSIANLLAIGTGEIITAAVSVSNFEAKNFLVMATENGTIKKTALEEFKNIRNVGIKAIELEEDDFLRWVRLTDGNQEILMGTAKGMGIRFPEKHVRSMGRNARGVRAIKLKKGDHVVSLDIAKKDAYVIVVTEKGQGKRTKISEYRLQSRGGSGIKTIKLKGNDLVGRLRIIDDDDEILLVSKNGTVSRQKASGISLQHRASSGVRLQKLDEDDYIVDLARVVTKEEES